MIVLVLASSSAIKVPLDPRSTAASTDVNHDVKAIFSRKYARLSWKLESTISICIVLLNVVPYN